MRSCAVERRTGCGVRTMRALVCCVGALLACAAGCRTQQAREERQEIDLLQLRGELQRHDAAERNRIGGSIVQRMKTVSEEARAAGREPVFDVLVLSGGGEYGAFGAGFLNGWHDAEDRGEPTARPDGFDLVTGVSTGAMIAPFAFVGEADAYDQAVELYASASQRDLAILRDLFFFLPWRPSFYRNDGLGHELDRQLNAPVASNGSSLAEQLALGHAENRPLLVGTTNLDLGRFQIWDLAAIAADAVDYPSLDVDPDETRTEQIRDVLLASSAIPAAFEPVDLGGTWHADGGASEQLFLGADRTFISRLDELWAHAHRSGDGTTAAVPPMPRIRVWIVVNNALQAQPEFTRRHWLKNARRSIETLVTSSTLFSLREIAALADEAERDHGVHIDVRYVSIPASFPRGDGDEIFNNELMLQLIRLGIEMGLEHERHWRSADELPGYRPQAYERD